MICVSLGHAGNNSDLYCLECSLRKAHLWYMCSYGLSLLCSILSIIVSVTAKNVTNIA